MGKKKIICDWNLKFKDKIGLKINVKIKLGQILGSTQGSKEQDTMHFGSTVATSVGQGNIFQNFIHIWELSKIEFHSWKQMKIIF